MLVLTRKQEQSIIIDDGRIKIKVLDARVGWVKFGIEAPEDIVIDREEVTTSKRKESNGSNSK